MRVLTVRLAVLLPIVLAGLVKGAVKTVDETWRDAERARDVPVRIYLDAAAEKPAPVILLSHGLGGSRAAMAYAAEAWAAHGYVCVALQHPGSDEAIWRDAPAGERMQRMQGATTVEQLAARCADVSFAIDELGRRESLRGRVDVARVGLAGHSFGAQTVQAIIGQRGVRREQSRGDDRVKAAVAFSPGFRGPAAMAAASFAGVKTPCFHFTGTEDEAPTGGAKPAQRRIPFDAIDAARQYLVILTGGDHAVFGGGEGCRTGADPKQYEAWQALIVELSTKFWDAELRGDAAARRWLGEQAKTTVGDAGTFEMKPGLKKADQEPGRAGPERKPGPTRAGS